MSSLQSAIRNPQSAIPNPQSAIRNLRHLANNPLFGKLNRTLLPQVREVVKQKLPDYMLPAAYVMVEAWPLTPNGKIDRQALPALGWQRQGSSTSLLSPRTPTEQTIGTIWQQVLGLEGQVSIHDNFFEVGGHSLLATQIVSRLRKTFQIDIPLSRLFEAPTIAALAEVVEHTQETLLSVINPVPRTAPLPLSFAQRRLWFLDQLEGPSPTYNMPTVLKLTGALNIEILTRCLNEIVQRHEILRTTIQTVQGEASQVIQSEIRLEPALIDLQQLSPDAQASEVKRLASLAALRPFDLSRDLMVRASLLRLSADDYILLFTMHHIASDGWSIGLLVREMSSLYEAFSQGKPSPLPALPIQYADFAQWQREWLQGERVAKLLTYWQEQLADAPPILALPTDYPRPAQQTFDGARLSFSLPFALSQRLHQLSQQAGTTLFMTLLAAFNVLLSRYSGEREIVVGVPIANRNRQELEPLIGFFVNTLALRTDLSGTPTFLDLLAQVRQVTQAAYDHQELPFEMLVDALQLERNLSHTPLFQVMFAFQNAPLPSLAKSLPLSGGVTLSPVEQEIKTARFDLNLSLWEENGALRGSWTYKRALFTAATIERMMGHFETLLAGFARHTSMTRHASLTQNPAQAITQLPLLSDIERQQLLYDWNQTQHEYPREQCIHQLFEAQVKRLPDGVAVVYEEQKLTYRELNQRANDIAYRLQGLGVQPDTCVGLYLERSLDVMVGMLAILKAGAAFVPLDDHLPPARLRFILSEAQATSPVRLVLTQSSLLERLPRDEVTALCLDPHASRPLAPSPSRPFPAAPDNLAYVIFTSGSTGQPKGVAVEHRQLANYLHAIVNRLALASIEREGQQLSFANVSTFAADLGHTMIFPALCTGGTLHIISEERSTNPDAFAEYFRQQAIDCFDCLKIVPSHFKALFTAAQPEAIIPRHRLIFGGERLDWELVRNVQALAPTCVIFNHYGPTETTVGVTTYRIPPDHALRVRPLEGATVPLGRPLNNTQLYILDAHLQPVPIGVPGELYIAGENVSRGYINRPELTNERFTAYPLGIANPVSYESTIEPLRTLKEQQGGTSQKGTKEGTEGQSEALRGSSKHLYPKSKLYRTGDLVRYILSFDANLANLEFLGRLDQQVKIRGFRIELGEVQAVLHQHPDVYECVVTAHEDQRGHKQLVGYVVAQDEHVKSDLVSRVRSFLHAKLPDYMVPAAFVLLDALPLTPNGKINRRGLPAPEFATTEDYVAPETDTSKKLAAIWQELLGVPQVGSHDNFFELGGDSIISIQIVARARQAGLMVTVKEIFQYQTIAALALVVTPLTETTAEQGLVTGNVPLTAIQQRFFARTPIDPHHYNQAMLLELSPNVQPALLAQALDQLLHHHDALRLRFAHDEMNASWQQWHATSLTGGILQVVDLAHLSGGEQRAALEGKAAAQQASLKLSQGPLMRLTLFTLGPNQPTVLHWLIHHLTVDGVSWRILLEDMETLYQQVKGGAPLALPAKSTSFKAWANWLITYADSQALVAEVDYWTEVGCGNVPALPVDKPTGLAHNTVASEVRLSQQLSPEETQALAQIVPAAYHTQVNDLLLTALMQAFSRWTGKQTLLFDLEGHGREELSQELDLSRTVGWFTSIFPVRLTLEGTSASSVEPWDSGEAIKSIKEQLRQIPNKGIGYGILRYLKQESALIQHPPAQVIFNYLGQLDNTRPSGSDTLIRGRFRANSGPIHSPSQKRGDLLRVNSMVIAEQLHVEWYYSRHIHRQSTIQRLADDFMEALRHLIAHCKNPEAGGYTPSDFDLAALDEEELDWLAGLIEQADGPHPPTP